MPLISDRGIRMPFMVKSFKFLTSANNKHCLLKFFTLRLWSVVIRRYFCRYDFLLPRHISHFRGRPLYYRHHHKKTFMNFCARDYSLIQHFSLLPPYWVLQDMMHFIFMISFPLEDSVCKGIDDLVKKKKW